MLAQNKLCKPQSQPTSISYKRQNINCLLAFYTTSVPKILNKQLYKLSLLIIFTNLVPTAYSPNDSLVVLSAAGLLVSKFDSVSRFASVLIMLSLPMKVPRLPPPPAPVSVFRNWSLAPLPWRRCEVVRRLLLALILVFLSVELKVLFELELLVRVNGIP